MYKKKEINIVNQYLIASILMLIFVLNDLMFDFFFTFNGSNYISFLFTVLASIITFVCSYGTLKFDIKSKTDKISCFVMSNFNAPQVILSILDIFCGIISILSGMVVLGSLFKIVKIIYIPVKFVVVANKGKSILKAIQRFSLIWVIGRLLSKKFTGVEKMKTWIKNNKMTLTYCIVLSPLSGFACFRLLQTAFTTIPLWVNICLAVLAGIVCCLLTIWLGGDKIKQAVFRSLSKVLTQDNYDKVINLANQLLTEQEIHKLALEEIEKENKANTELMAKDKILMSEEAKNALIKAEVERIKRESEKS